MEMNRQIGDGTDLIAAYSLLSNICNFSMYNRLKTQKLLRFSEIFLVVFPTSSLFKNSNKNDQLT